MFEPMALTVILALLSAFVLSLTFVPAMIAIAITGRVTETDNRAVRRLKTWNAPLLRRTIDKPLAAIATWDWCCLPVPLVHSLVLVRSSFRRAG